MKSIPQQVSKSVRERNPHLYGTPSPGWETSIVEPPKRIRQSTKPLMNKLEQEWFDEMSAKWAGSYVFHPQCLRFKLGNGIWYKPDFLCFNWLSRLACWEIKGPFAHRGGLENLKIAASKYPNVQWTLCWKQDGKWCDQIILP